VQLDDADFVRRQYESTDRLEARISVWHPDAGGRWPQDVALDAIGERSPRRVLEVGAGTGAFAARCSRKLGCDVVALDASPEMMATSSAAGVESIAGDVQQLPFADGSFDVCVAAWMLYHVADVDRALAELARVLQPSGRLVAITNGRDHIGELWDLVGAPRFESSFSRENGRAQLERHFTSVAATDVHTRAVFPDREAIATYLVSLDHGDLVDRLPQLREPFIARGAPTVFIADRS